MTTDAPQPAPAATNPSALRFRAGIVVLAVLVALSVVLAAGIGAVHVPAREIVCMLLNRSGIFHFRKRGRSAMRSLFFRFVCREF